MYDCFAGTARTAANERAKALTVPHLEDTVVAHETLRQLVVHGHHVAAAGAPVVLLVGLVLAAGGVRVVAAGEVRVDGAVDPVPLRPSQGVLVEALLSSHAVGIVEVAGVADEKLEVPLDGEKSGWTEGGGG